MGIVYSRITTCVSVRAKPRNHIAVPVSDDKLERATPIHALAWAFIRSIVANASAMVACWLWGRLTSHQVRPMDCG
jgi:hypothetical protein